MTLENFQIIQTITSYRNLLLIIKIGLFMKKFILISVLIFFQSHLLSLAVEKDSLSSIENDSLNSYNKMAELIKENQDDDKWFYWTGVFGLGSTLRSTYSGNWNAYWHDGPASSIGVELAFSSTRNFNIEIYNYFGFLKKTDKIINGQTLMHYGIIANINDSHSLKILSIALGINFKLLSLMDDNKLNIFGNFGFPFFPLDKAQPCFLGGIGLKYKFDLTTTMALNYICTVKPPNLFGGPLSLANYEQRN
jgi:hypothetical protein